MSFGTIAILGPGLIGGSLALAVAEYALADQLVIWSRSEKPFEAIRADLPKARLTTDILEAVREADLVVLCLPIETMAGFARTMAGALKPTAVVTDVGSVKGTVARETAAALAGQAHWIGSHPMAGSEKTGFGAARADLFKGATVIVTPAPGSDLLARETVTRFWTACQGHVVYHPPEEHDRLVAQVSHLPHLLASVLVSETDEAALPLAGGGFRDSTRIAAGSADLWSEILSVNAAAIAPALRRLIARLETVAGELESLPNAQAHANLRALLEAAQDRRSHLP